MKNKYPESEWEKTKLVAIDLWREFKVPVIGMIILSIILAAILTYAEK